MFNPFQKQVQVHREPNLAVPYIAAMMSSRTSFLIPSCLTGLLLLILAVPLALFAQDTSAANELLVSPRKSVHTFLHWQQEGHSNPERAMLVIPESSGLNVEERQERVAQLLRVLNSKGMLLDLNQIPADPDFRDELTSSHQYILAPSLPEVYLVKTGSTWVFSSSTIDRIPQLYRASFSTQLTYLVDHLPPAFQANWIGLRLWQYLALFLWILCGLIIRTVVKYLIHKYGERIAKRTKTKWDDLVVYAAEKPVALMAAAGFLALTYKNLLLPVEANVYLSVIIDVALSASMIWLAYNMINVLSDYLAGLTAKTDSKLDDQLVPLVRKSLKVSIVVLGIIFILQNNGINVGSLLAGLGLGGLAFALAARDTLANFFGSITIFVDKPFQIGDWILMDGVEGIVEEVGFRSTRIRTFYNSVITVPNSRMADSPIDNYGMRQYRRVKAVLNVTYSTSPEQIEAFVEGIKGIIKAHPNMRQDFYEVHFNNYGAHSLDILVYAFFDVPTWSDELQQKHNFYLSIL